MVMDRQPKLSQIRVILENPHSGYNVGSTCRAMKNMGLDRLYIVGSPDLDWRAAEITAVHAVDLLKKATVCPNLEAALRGVSLALGVTRRRGKWRKYFAYSPAAAAQMLLIHQKKPSALVFGNEASGLSAADLRLCHAAVSIPSSASFPSLNLAQAVQIMAYEIFKAAIDKKSGDHRYKPIDSAEMSLVTGDIITALKSLGFFKLVKPDNLEIFWRDILARAGISKNEGRQIRLLFAKIQGLAGRKHKPR